MNYLEGLTGDTSLGKGPILTRGSIMNPKIHEKLLEHAKELGINIQLDISTSRSFTDADDIYDRHYGIPTYLISIPLRYMHSSVEVCCMKDVEEIIELIVAFIIAFDGGNCFANYVFSRIFKPRIIPRLVATPLPPLNPKNTG